MWGRGGIDCTCREEGFDRSGIAGGGAVEEIVCGDCVFLDKKCKERASVGKYGSVVGSVMTWGEVWRMLRTTGPRFCCRLGGGSSRLVGDRLKIHFRLLISE